MPLAPAKTLIARFPDASAQVMTELGLPRAFIEAEKAAMEEVRVAPTANRSVVGVMNDMGRWLDRWHLDDDEDLLEVSLGLADRPTGSLRFIAPADELLGVVADLGQTVPPGRRARRRPAGTGAPSSPVPTSATAPDGSTIEITHRPELAAEVLEELKPFLAADGIDFDDPDAPPDLEALQAAMDRAVERRNDALFAPAGTRRESSVTLLVRFASAMARDDDATAVELLDQVQPAAPNDRAPEVAAVIGVALELLDEWLSGRAPDAPKDLGASVHLPKGWRRTARPAAEILALGARDRAAQSSGALITRQGGRQVLAGAAVASAATAEAWSRRAGTPLDTLLPRIMR